MRDRLGHVAATAAICAAVVLFVPPEGVRLPFALPLTLLLPGYAITVAAFGPQRPDPPMLLVLSVSLSLATLAVGSLVLDLVPGGLRRGSWAALLLCVVLGGCLIAARRGTPPSSQRGRGPRMTLEPANAVLLAGAVLATSAAMALAWTPLPAKNALGYTQLWMLPARGGDASAVQVGIVSEEQDPVAYDLEVTFGDARVPVRRRIVLGPAQRRTFRIGIGRPPPGTQVPVTARLFRHDDPMDAYRRVTAWVPNGGPRDG
jgi:uncharacterized membrane protein